MPNVIALGGGAFGWWLGYEGRAPTNGVTPYERGSREIRQPLHHVWTQGEAGICNPEEILHETPNLPVPWIWTSQPLELWEINVLLFKPPSLCDFIIADWTETLMKNNLPSLLTNAVSSSVPLWNLSNAFKIMINSCRILPPPKHLYHKKGTGMIQLV